MNQPAPPLSASSLDQGFWDDLLAFIEERRVIPIIGADLLEVELDGAPATLDRWIAVRLAAALGIAAAELPDGFSLNDVVCAHRVRGGQRELIYPRLRNLLREASFPVPEPLRQLAAIRDFNLYVTTTFDSLLEDAVNAERFGGEKQTDILSYAPNKPLTDLPCEKEQLTKPTIFHLLGKLATTASYAVSDEDVLEFVCALQGESACPEKLFDALESHHLLLLGCGFSDWLERFFLRMAKRRRLSDPRDVSEVVADYPPQDPGLVLFLERVSSRTTVVRGGAPAFIAELWRRWEARQPAVTPAGNKLRRFFPPEMVMPRQAIFISYAREDFAAVKTLKSALDQAGIVTWFDMAQLPLGTDWKKLIEDNIAQCSFFMPVVSAQTEQRHEGEFLREWRLAAARAERMAQGVTFFLPVFIDDTPADDRHLPAEIKRSTIFRLPGGEPTEEFIATLRTLFQSP